MSDDMLSRYTGGTHKGGSQAPPPAPRAPSTPLASPPTTTPSSWSSSSSSTPSTSSSSPTAPTSSTSIASPSFAAASPPDAVESTCIAVLSGSTALMLDLVFRDGNRLALGYSYLSSVALDCSGTLTLAFVTHTVTIKGRNLGAAYAALRSHTCLRLSEASRDFDPGTGEVFIAGIEVKEA